MASRLATSLVLVLAVSALAVATAAPAVRNGQLEYQTIVDALAKTRQHTKFLTLLQRSGIQPWLIGYLGSTKTGYTLFAPTDAAFLKMTPAATKQWGTKAAWQQALLKFHMLNFQATMARLTADKVGQGYVTFRGTSLLQKYNAAAKNAITLGPQFATTGPQLANVGARVYMGPVSIVYSTDTVFVPVK
eukprot:TRINITY_DN89_c0_g2_i1.p2 TRINITY_DN89_c0_g2~~TRINITY_DN89_c0_g2_i1.p2  ORF type:complete len:189 (+),score=13.09 TRINITY_DN89_c0_g2_i1:90-656(+)